MTALLLVLALAGGRFAEDCSDCWPGWTVAQDAASGRQISVQGRAGRVTVQGVSSRPDDNQQHLRLTGSTGASGAHAELAFLGPPPLPGWAHLFSAPVGADGAMGWCDWLGIPTVPGSQGWTLTVHDDGPTWVGAYLGNPDAQQIGRWPRIPPPQDFVVLALLQRLAQGTRVLGVSTVLPAPQWGEPFSLAVSVDGGQASAIVRRAGRAAHSVQAKLRAAPAAGQIGLIARTAPHTLCSDDGFLREFMAHRVEAR